MPDTTRAKLNWRGLGLRLLAGAGGGLGLVALGLSYSRIGGT